MTMTDWITDIALVLVVFRQLREGRLDLKSFLIPLGIVAFVAHTYLDSIPTAGSDLVLVGALMAAGAALGIAGGVYTRIRVAGEHLLIKAGAVSAILWVLGMGARMGFQVWVEHGGSDDVARFSVAHHITTDQAWVAAFVLMALTEVVTRLATIFLRGRMVARQEPRVAAAPAARTLDRSA
uniref:Integral membrane protein n=1 Tax=Streptomyces sp. NBC_00003 TaxID=2903608 RepID=A0AAU2UYX1_9ACTN